MMHKEFTRVINVYLTQVKASKEVDFQQSDFNPLSASDRDDETKFLCMSMFYHRICANAVLL